MPPEQTTVGRAEGLVEHLLPERTPKRRMLVIVNPYATTVSDRLRNLVVYALQSRYSVEAIDTEARGHATQITREAASEGYDLVVAFGGDGTVNEAANGLAGSETPLTCLPGGSTNVFCRTLGIPADVVDATEHLLRMADEFRPRRVDTGRVNGRRFVFASGIGLDASVVERVDSHPRLKSRLGEYYFTWAALSSFNRRYLIRPPRLRIVGAGKQVEGVTVIVQNSDPYTYFGRFPIRIAPGAALDSGSLSLAILTRATPLSLPAIIPRVFAGRPAALARHRHVETFEAIGSFAVEATDGRTLPLEVDGDFIGEVERAEYSVAPASLSVVS
ncbi:MAG: diacylglycerol kinase family protein [Thermoleophilaceae bacterium]